MRCCAPFLLPFFCYTPPPLPATAAVLWCCCRDNVCMCFPLASCVLHGRSPCMCTCMYVIGRCSLPGICTEYRCMDIYAFFTGTWCQYFQSVFELSTLKLSLPGTYCRMARIAVNYPINGNTWALLGECPFSACCCCWPSSSTETVKSTVPPNPNLVNK